MRFRRAVIVAVIGGALLSGCAGSPPLTARQMRLVGLRTALGVAYLRQGQLGLARHELQMALSTDAHNANANNAMGLVEERLGESGKARHYFRTGLKHHPHDGSLQNNYGAFLCSHGEIKAALRHFHAALASPLYPTPQLADENMGICLLKVPDLPQAVHYFHRAQALAPAMAEPFYYLAKVHYEQHHDRAARADIRRYLHTARSARALALGVRIGRATHDTHLVRYCATRLLAGFAKTPEAHWVERLQREGKLLGN
ncbi:MAG: type IV pilus biogenesis/stability protein PilW [Gammaproteobacteria bacterium]|nr:type IV pilus biogenesis/stability protein PilW [Gammaproteobacteria bacterium]